MKTGVDPNGATHPNSSRQRAQQKQIQQVSGSSVRKQLFDRRNRPLAREPLWWKTDRGTLKLG
jgi:hypothetical protein